MKLTDNKKAPESWRMRSLIELSLNRKSNMTSLTQNQFNTNAQPLVLGGFSIRQDDEGRYCLNDLHKASGSDKKHQPAYFIRNQQTKDLVLEIENPSNGASANLQTPAIGKINDGKNNGTYVVKELVYSYAMWISAKFHLQVIRAYDSLVMEWLLNDKQTISPDQAGILYNIVHTRAAGNKNLIVQMWSRLKNHFKYSASYRELKAFHFEDAKHYLEVMDLKAKKETESRNEGGVNQTSQPWQDVNVQFLMWYVPKLAKIIKDDVYPALRLLRSEYAAQVIGYAQEAVCHANVLNRIALNNGMTHYDRVGGHPVHTLEWYLDK
ncbi:KilA-N domain-containing protein [Acinetobacter sp. MD2(2019)]|uniref:KilA-N domain-containing protein n=1 Tax=Acinetobacter sp. MD2(2019) TaxID=2605273 RepID=UPI002D1F83BF|nr:KilA-N domain-containing protein [Acinetobacter sp. MD2(2019)]MEB3753821.1 KilA-N domain-containing protein [Acinetobacter sp. MD2(2019)]